MFQSIDSRNRKDFNIIQRVSIDSQVNIRLVQFYVSIILTVWFHHWWKSMGFSIHFRHYSESLLNRIEISNGDWYIFRNKEKQRVLFKRERFILRKINKYFRNEQNSLKKWHAKRLTDKCVWKSIKKNNYTFRRKKIRNCKNLCDYLLKWKES